MQEGRCISLEPTFKQLLGECVATVDELCKSQYLSDRNDVSFAIVVGVVGFVQQLKRFYIHINTAEEIYNLKTSQEINNLLTCISCCEERHALVRKWLEERKDAKWETP